MSIEWNRAASRSRTVLQVGAVIAVAIGTAASGYTLGMKAGYTEGLARGYQRGGEAGFESGLATGQMTGGALTGAAAAHASELIEKGDTVRAVSFLEDHVDYSLLLYKAFGAREPSPFDRLGVASAASKTMRLAAEHRTDHPHTSQDAGVRDTVDQIRASLLANAR